MEWMGGATNNHWCTVPSVSRICKGISQVPTKIGNISGKNNTPNPLIFYFKVQFLCNKNPTHRWFLSFINCLDSLVRIPPLNTLVSFLGFGFSHGKKNVNKKTHILRWRFSTAHGPATWAHRPRVAAALEESGGAELPIGFCLGKKKSVKRRQLLGCPVGFVRIHGDRINGLFHLLINGVYWGYNLLTNHLLSKVDGTGTPCICLYTLGPQNYEKWRFSSLKYGLYTP